MLHEKSRELVDLTLRKWLSDELFSLQWFVLAGVVAVFYTVWLIQLDRKRMKDLLLIGSLSAVVYAVNSFLIIQFLGLADYLVHLVPIYPPIFATSVTVAPVIVMISQQRTSSWKGYLLWTAPGFALLSLVIFPVYTSLGILELHKNWNWFYNYLVLLAEAQIVRLVYLWFDRIQRKHS